MKILHSAVEPTRSINMSNWSCDAPVILWVHNFCWQSALSRETEQRFSGIKLNLVWFCFQVFKDQFFLLLKHGGRIYLYFTVKTKHRLTSQILNRVFVSQIRPSDVRRTSDWFHVSSDVTNICMCCRGNSVGLRTYERFPKRRAVAVQNTSVGFDELVMEEAGMKINSCSDSPSSLWI